MSLPFPGAADCVLYSIAIVLMYQVSNAAYLLTISPLAKFPGPKLWAISRLPLSWYAFQGTQWQALEKLHEKHGPIIRIAPNELSTTSPTSWEDVYNSRPIMPKDPFSQTPPLNNAPSLFTAIGKTHSRIRATLVNAFSDKALREQAPIIESYADALVDRMQREAGKGHAVDLEKLYGYATLDIIADLTYGESFHGLEGNNEHDRIRSFFLHAKFGNIRNLLSRIAPLDRIFGYVFMSFTRKHRLSNWQTTTEKIRRRLAMSDVSKQRCDFMTPVIGKVNEGGVKGITMAELTTNGLGLVIAGCQLSTVALATATYFMLRYPATLHELVSEVRKTFERLDDITVQATQGMPYLEAVVSETLRIHHPTPISLPRVVPREGRVIDGEFIPGNTIIGVNLQNIQNASANWVEPGKFHPQRFLPPGDIRYETRFDRDAKFGFKPFSTGPRNCLGAKVFLAEARVILAKILWTFDIEAANPHDMTWPKQKAYLVFEPKALFVNLKTRTLQ